MTCEWRFVKTHELPSTPQINSWCDFTLDVPSTSHIRARSRCRAIQSLEIESRNDIYIYYYLHVYIINLGHVVFEDTLDTASGKQPAASQDPNTPKV